MQRRVDKLFIIRRVGERIRNQATWRIMISIWWSMTTQTQTKISMKTQIPMKWKNPTKISSMAPTNPKRAVNEAQKDSTRSQREKGRELNIPTSRKKRRTRRALSSKALYSWYTKETSKTNLKSTISTSFWKECGDWLKTERIIKILYIKMLRSIQQVIQEASKKISLSSIFMIKTFLKKWLTKILA